MQMNIALKSALKTDEVKRLSPLQIAELCARAADDKKANEIKILDVSKLTSFADYFVICGAPSERQVQAIVKNVEDELSMRSIKAIGVEGKESSSWILLDLGDVIFHCFTDAAREYYDLEGFWIDAVRLSYK
ncbi:MAG TPA: ribosome silencing factor [Myxococcota bacterium]|nr:ribosome silencing factor [Myxococcota bacterium]